ncbi:MAG: alpha/beta hydrolase [Candidatus Kerfeldbacteria bacterium]|nr:alpha/beta hydrolase [Candidatus Kerfeldbacteria bacterium]
MRKLRSIILWCLLAAMIGLSVFEIFFWFGTPTKAFNQTQDERITVSGTNIVYNKQGQGEAILLIHSGAWSSLEYEAMASALDDHYTVYRVDLPGFGKSDKPQITYDLPFLTTKMAGFIQQFPEQTVHLVGASFGGTIALQLAAQYPERIRSLTLIDPIGFGSEINQLALVAQIPLLAEFLFYPNRTIFNYSLNHGLVDAQQLPEQYREQLYQNCQLPKAQRAKLSILRSSITVRGVDPVMQQAVTTAAAAVQQPVLLVWGEQDTYAPITQLENAKAKLPQATSIILPHTGHFAHMESPKLIVEQLQLFLKKYPL